MSKVSSSPERHSFQKEGYINRAEEEGKEPEQDYLDWWEQIKIDEANKIHDPEWQKNNLEYDLRSTDWIVEKARASDDYAQNIYAALCNNEFMKLAVVPILKEETWSCSWRHAGGIVADMLEKGDYIDWYCSGISNEELGNGLTGADGTNYVPESVVTIEVREDLKKLGWIVIEEKEEK
jgi:hypothetical protein